MSRYQELRSWLAQETDGRVLGLFRLIYGLAMCYEMVDYFQIELVQRAFLRPLVLFGYDGFEWLRPLPEPAMKGILFAMLACAGCIAAGVFFKWACRIFSVLYLYFFLLDKGIYNNHLYLFILLGFLLSFTDADRFLSLRKNPENITTVPRWQIVLLQYQFLLVYFFGGVAKLSSDWLVRCEPITTLTGQIPDTAFLAGVMKTKFAIAVLTYGGFLIDILAPILLWVKPLRRFAVLFFVFFHFSNSRIFDDIGIFPYLMLAALILFFETHEIPLLRDIGKGKGAPSSKKKTAPIGNAVRHYPGWYGPVLVGYCVFQFVFPLRGYFLPNQMDYTTIGNRFSWHMKVDTRSVQKLVFYWEDPSTGKIVPAQLNTLLNDMQIRLLTIDPRAVRTFAQALHKEGVKRGGPTDTKVKAIVKIGYNGRASQDFVRPEVDLSKVSYSPWATLDWVVPVSN